MITPIYTTKLGLIAQKTSVEAQKIDSLLLKIYSIVSASFSLLKTVRFFEKTFLLVDTNIEIVLGMLFLALNNANF